MASKAITAIGTTTAIATVPLFDRPLEPVDGIAVILELVRVIVDKREVELAVVRVVGVMMGTYVLVDV